MECTLPSRAEPLGFYNTAPDVCADPDVELLLALPSGLKRPLTVFGLVLCPALPTAPTKVASEPAGRAGTPFMMLLAGRAACAVLAV